MQEKRPSPSRFLTSVEVAAFCGVSTRTVSNWIRDGAIPAHRTVGGHGRVAVGDLRRFLAERGMPIPPELAGTGAPRPADPPAAATSPPEHAPTSRPEPAATPAPERRRRILVIDDDEALLEAMRGFLGSAGYDVETARHGFLAGYLAGTHRPDVILLDLLMPGLDGYEVLSVLRRSEARSTPVLACTSLKEEAEARIRAAGFDGYVRKPVDFGALLRLVEGLRR